MTVADRRAFIAELEAHDPVFPTEVIEKAKELHLIAMRGLALKNAVLENRLMMLGQPAYTSAIPTLAVTAKPGTGIVMAINPHFAVNQLTSVDWLTWGYGHEGLHLFNKHLLTDRHGDAWELSCECCINHENMATFLTGMPTWHTEDGGIEEFGVNPRKIWEKYRDDLKAQGKQYVTYETFIATDLGCFAELSKMTKLPRPPRSKNKESGGAWNCGHHGDNQLPLDQDEVDDAVNEVLDSAMRKATVEQDPRFRDALRKLAKRTGDDEKASKIWGTLGIGELFGEAVQRKQVKFWAQWLRRQLASRLVPGRRMVYNRKLAAVDHQLRRDPILAFKGKNRERSVMIVVDSSGSMSGEQLEWLHRFVGEEKNLHAEFFCADTELYKLEWGKPFEGRGGTDFQCVDDYVRTMKSKPDAIIMVTDGYVNKVVPGGDPRKLVWLITHDGDDWPARHETPMATFKLPDPALV